MDASIVASSADNAKNLTTVIINSLTCFTLCATPHVRKTRLNTWNVVSTTDEGTIPMAQ